MSIRTDGYWNSFMRDSVDVEFYNIPPTGGRVPDKEGKIRAVLKGKQRGDRVNTRTIRDVINERWPKTPLTISTVQNIMRRYADFTGTECEWILREGIE